MSLTHQIPADLRIYANVCLGSGPARPRPNDQTCPPVPTTIAPIATRTIEQELTRILDTLRAAGESVQQAFDGKERALHQLIDTLTTEECTKLHASLTTDD